MYSVVLATMLAANTAAPSWGCYGGCYGCYGNAFSCMGCYGCWGCCGGCWGCCGGCYGCYGGVVYTYSGCFGCCGGCFGCCGGVVYPVVEVAPPVVAYGQSAVAAAPPAPPPPPPEGQLRAADQRFDNMEHRLNKIEATLGKLIDVLEKAKTSKPKQGSEGASAPTVNRLKGRVVVRLPADAKLYVDGVYCPLTSGVRSFNTPELTPGRSYYYLIRAEVIRNGEVKSDSQIVVTRAGNESKVDFSNLADAPNSLASITD